MKLELLSKYRTHIMGAAMMWIMFFHSPFSGGGDVMQFIHRIGFYGVDMFLLVSGLGLYYSMRKSKGVLDFYKKRAVRILPAYLLVTICWYLFFKTDVGFGDAVLSILGVNYFRGSVYGRPPYFDWFLPTLFVLYLLTPLYDKLFQKVQCKWKLTALASMISPILCMIAVWTGRQPLEGTFVRIPDFLIGYCIGWFLFEKREEKKGSWMVHISLLFSGLLLGWCIQNKLTDFRSIFWGINAYPALLVAPALSVILAWLFMYVDKGPRKLSGSLIKAPPAEGAKKPGIGIVILEILGKILLAPFWICGRYSLEIYLIHQRLMEILSSEGLTAFRSDVMRNIGSYDMYYFLIAVVSIILAAALHELISLAVKGFKRIGMRN